MDEHEAIINAQTGKLSWAELAVYFARGVVLCVAPGRDLVTVARQLATDDHHTIEELLEQADLHPANDSDARRWDQQSHEFWAVVIAPWVLVQEVGPGDRRRP